jgi:hypothetical protein
VQSYLDPLVQLCLRGDWSVVSVIVFGSAAKGGFSSGVSDVDSIIVLEDGATRPDKMLLASEVSRLEISHGLRAPELRPKTKLEAFAERSGGNALSSFVCCRSDLLSGSVARVLGLRRAEALFVDRIVFANIIASAVTVWGEDLLPRVPVPEVRRVDVFKALFALAGQVLLGIAGFSVMPDATKYATGALKRSLHSCFFCYQSRTAPLQEEVAFFRHILGEHAVLDDLLALRQHYRRSFRFVVRCLPTLARLHVRTAWDNEFPLRVMRNR